MRDRDESETMESMLDSLLEAVAGKSDDDFEAPALAAENLAASLRLAGLGVGADIWDGVAETFRRERTTVREFRAMTRRSLGKLAAGE